MCREDGASLRCGGYIEVSSGQRQALAQAGKSNAIWLRLFISKAFSVILDSQGNHIIFGAQFHPYLAGLGVFD